MRGNGYRVPAFWARAAATLGIGAVVGVQPFGGQGLSGTGPKAGGPQYLHQFATERTLSVNTTAAGGNASLVSLEEEGPSARS